MRRLLSVVLLLFLYIGCTKSKVIDVKSAEALAFQFFRSKESPVNARKKIPQNSDISLSYTKVQEGEALLYVFSQGEDGFVIVSADDNTNESILGYSETGRFNIDSIPESLRYWLEEYCKQIVDIRINSSKSRKNEKSIKAPIPP